MSVLEIGMQLAASHMSWCFPRETVRGGEVVIRGKKESPRGLLPICSVCADFLFPSDLQLPEAK